VGCLSVPETSEHRDPTTASNGRRSPAITENRSSLHVNVGFYGGIVQRQGKRKEAKGKTVGMGRQRTADLRDSDEWRFLKLQNIKAERYSSDTNGGVPMMFSVSPHMLYAASYVLPPFSLRKRHSGQ
jgi:hypothetical protein